MTHAEDDIRGWFAGQVPDDWFVAVPKINGDREEIMVIGTLPGPKT